MEAFLICPVRGHDISETEGVVGDLEAIGYTVHWPHRDTDQSDSTGYNICLNNLAAISNSEIVFVLWDGNSQGCLFDLGMAFALHKPIMVIDLPKQTKGKSFQNMIRHWASKEAR